MRPTIIIILTFLGNAICSFPTNAQSWKEYTGYDISHYKVIDTTSEINIAEAVWDTKKTLALFKKDSFLFKYTVRGEPCAARASYWMCFGTYKMTGDTIDLTSNYKRTDFIKVADKEMKNAESGKLYITTKYPAKLNPEVFINEFDLRVDGVLKAEFKEIGDTIILDNVSPGSLLSFSACSPYSMGWEYTYQGSEKNFLTFTLIRHIKDINIYMENYRLLRKGKKLFVLSGSHLKVKDDIFRQQ